MSEYEIRVVANGKITRRLKGHTFVVGVVRGQHENFSSTVGMVGDTQLIGTMLMDLQNKLSGERKGILREEGRVV
jgi:hypothetical protein